jgi:protein-disulfide isomerase
MGGARRSRAPAYGARAALALLCALGSVACERPGQAGAVSRVAGSQPRSGEIDVTSPGGPRWPAFEQSGEEPTTPDGTEQDRRRLTDADVEQIATKLPHERVPLVSAQNPAKGPANAKVTLQVFSDFECPFCVRAAPTLDDVEERYRGRLRLVWRNYPLPSHERARPAARAALGAFAQGGNEQFWKLHDWLYSPQADLSDAGLKQAAVKLSLDPARFEQAVTTTQYDAQIHADMAAGDAAGIEGTPAAFINDYYLMGARSEAEYAIVVERALREAG